MNDTSKTPRFEIEPFNPKKAELAEMAKKYSGLKISGIDDSEGLAKVSKARKELASTRCDIQNKLKAARDPAIAFQNAVLALEKELVGIIEPVEKELKAEEAKVEAEKRRILEEEAAKNRAELNRRVGELAKVGYSHDLEELKVMEEGDFELLLAEKSVAFEEERKRREEEEKRVAEERAELEKLRKEAQERERAELEAKRESERNAVMDESRRPTPEQPVTIEEPQRDPEFDSEINEATEKEANRRRMRSFAEFVHKAALQFGHQETYELLVRLAGTVGKLYDEEEQFDALVEECEMWAKDPTCFS